MDVEGDPCPFPPRRLFNGFVIDSGTPIGFRSTIGELLAVGGFVPPILIGTPIGFKFTIGLPV
jgi:hypothetical protein